MNDKNRIIFLDYLRVLAIFMVMLVHSCECFYFGNEGGFLIESLRDAGWLIGIDSACRAAVPLFVMASAYLLFPVTKPTGEFLTKRILRVGAQFAVWCCVYNWRNGGSWGQMLFNFPMATGGHLWFVPMLIGLYLLMPLLSPWAEKASEREVRGWLGLWLLTTTFPYLRKLWGFLYGDPAFGAVPYLYGECPWNGFGTFQYVSGFFGYVLLGFYFRRFGKEWSWKRTWSVALPLLAAGWAAVALPFFLRIAKYGAEYPVKAPYAAAVDLEMSWEFCSLGVVLTVIAYFLIIRRLRGNGGFYRYVVRPLAEASYGVYLVHILVLVAVAGSFKSNFANPYAIALIAIATFVPSAAVSYAIRRIPKVGKWLVG